MVLIFHLWELFVKYMMNQVMSWNLSDGLFLEASNTLLPLVGVSTIAINAFRNLMKCKLPIEAI